MPRVFKPKIRPVVNKINRNDSREITENFISVSVSQVDKDSQQKLTENEDPLLHKPIEKEVVQTVAEVQPFSPEKTVSSKSSVQSSVKKCTSKKKSTNIKASKPLTVDIDNFNPKISNFEDIARPKSIKLFSIKSAPRKLEVYGDAPPPADKPLDRSTVTLRSLLNWVPINKPPPKIRDINPNPPSSKIDVSIRPKSPTPLDSNKKQDGFHNESLNAPDEAVDPFAPQLCLDADGNIVLDERSLHIERPIEESNIAAKHVAEEAGLYGTTYNSFRRKPIQHRGRKWTEKDTTRFYRALSTIGTDFYSMTKLFPDRSRNQLLKKFKREERLFPHLVDDALKNKRNYDITVFYTSESEGEHYDKLTREAIKAKRKDKSNRKSEPKHRSTCDISALIDEVLARDAEAERNSENSTNSNEAGWKGGEKGISERGIVGSSDEEESEEVIPRKRLRRVPIEKGRIGRNDRSPRISLSDMIERTVAEANAANRISL